MLPPPFWKPACPQAAVASALCAHRPPLGDGAMLTPGARLRALVAKGVFVALGAGLHALARFVDPHHTL